MKKKIIFSLIVMFLFAICLAACDTSPLVGTWIEEEGASFRFFRNGSGIFSEFSEDDKFSWEITERNKLKLDFEGKIIIFDYKISGSKLVFIDEGEEVLSFRKK